MANYFGTPTEFVSVIMSKVQDEVSEGGHFDSKWKRGRRAHNWGLRLIGGDSGWNQEVEDRLDGKLKKGKLKMANEKLKMAGAEGWAELDQKK